MRVLGTSAAMAVLVAMAATPAAASPDARSAQAGAAPAFRSAARADTRARARALRIRVPRGVAAGDVLLAAVSVRTGRARTKRPRSGWRRLRVTRSRRGGLTQALYMRTAGGSEPRSHRWRFRRPVAAAGGIVAYTGVDALRPVAADGGAVTRRGRSPRVPSPRLSGARGPTRAVAFFARRGRLAAAPPGGAAERFDARSRGGISSAAVDFAHAGGPVARRFARMRRAGGCRADRCRASGRAIGQVVVLRPAGASSAPPVSNRPGLPPAGAEFPPPLPESHGPAFHVATSGSDSNPGTAAAPWRTVQKALDTLRPSQRAVVHAGTYDQALDLDRACAAGQPCTVEAAVGEARPVLRATDDHVLRVNEEGAYWRFRGFTFRDANITSGGLVDLYGHHLELSGNELTASGDQDFYLDEASHHVQLLGNHMHHSGLGRTHQSHGAYVQGDDHLVANNLIHDHPYGFGIQVYDKGLRSIVVNNTITHNAHSGIVVGGGGGVSGVIVRNNILAYNEDQGLSWDSTCPDGSAGTTEADHNVIFGNANGAIDDQDCPATSTAGGNRLSDPLFVDVGARNFHLRPGSPAFGYSLAEWTPANDFDGEPRGQGGASDAGAYEDG
jgi:hypothetical protein